MSALKAREKQTQGWGAVSGTEGGAIPCISKAE
jgi:hypothetical protein